MGEALGQDEETTSPLLPGRQYLAPHSIALQATGSNPSADTEGFAPLLLTVKPSRLFFVGASMYLAPFVATPPLPLPLDGRGVGMLGAPTSEHDYA
jgi:hypothetical protein